MRVKYIMQWRRSEAKREDREGGTTSERGSWESLTQEVTFESRPDLARYPLAENGSYRRAFAISSMIGKAEL